MVQYLLTNSFPPVLELNCIFNSNFVVFSFEDSKTFGQQPEKVVEGSEAIVEQQAHLYILQLKPTDLLVIFLIDHGLAFPLSISVVVLLGVQLVCQEC